MPDPSPWDVYSKQLFRCKKGYPLWRPEPTPKGEVSVGDVGYEHDGQFFRLFNTTLPGDHESHRRWGVPEEFKPFEKSAYGYNRDEDAIQPGEAVCSRSVKSVKISGQLSAYGGGGGVDFECHEDQGAFLMVQDGAIKEELHRSRRLANYMFRNHQRWLEFATEKHDLALHREDLMLVRGAEGRSTKISFNGDFGAPAQASFSFSASHARQSMMYYPTRTGPRNRRHSISRSNRRLTEDSEDTEGPEARDTNSPMDQCIFMNFYKLKKRLFRPLTVMEAAAEPQDLSPGPGSDHEGAAEYVRSDSSETSEIEEVPAPEKNSDPATQVLDYILEHSTAEAAIAMDTDILELCKDGEIPDDIPAFLNDLRPHIEVNEDGLGMLSFEDIRADPIDLELEQSGANVDDHAGPSAEDSHSEHKEDVTLANTRFPKNEPQGPIVVLDDNAVGIRALAFSDDSQYVASGAEDTITVYDTETGHPVNQFTGHELPICCIAFSPSGMEVASSSRGNDVIVWNVLTGEERIKLRGHSRFANYITYSPDGTSIATASMDFVVRLWDAENGRMKWESSLHTAMVMQLVFSPNGARLASCSADCTAQIVDVDDGTGVAVLSGHEAVVYSVAFSRDGERIATGSEDGSSRIWKAESGVELVIIREHTGSVWATVFSPDGKRVLSVASDGMTKVCDSFSGERLLEIDAGDGLANAAAVSFSGDGARISASNGDSGIGKFPVLAGHMDDLSHVQFSPDGQYIVSAANDSTLRLWNLREIDMIDD
ncbi:WD40-repeat-containing domain protein [Amylocystis lapponica]|nr:WD40-repeat-containing domain protein [Amylocystis lapponica]